MRTALAVAAVGCGNRLNLGTSSTVPRAGKRTRTRPLTPLYSEPGP